MLRALWRSKYERSVTAKRYELRELGSDVHSATSISFSGGAVDPVVGDRLSVELVRVWGPRLFCWLRAID